MYAPTYGVNLTPDFPIVSLYQHHSPGGEMRLLHIYYYLLRSDARQICHQSNGAMSCSHFRLRDF